MLRAVYPPVEGATAAAMAVPIYMRAGIAFVIVALCLVLFVLRVRIAFLSEPKHLAIYRQIFDPACFSTPTPTPAPAPAPSHIGIGVR